MNISGPATSVEAACERVLRGLPLWFGIEESLLQYASDTGRLATFVAEEAGLVVGFLSLQQHFAASWEVHCIAVDAAFRNQGVGKRLHRFVEGWLAKRGAKVLQVKTLAPSHPSPEYARTRAFYAALGYVPLEVFPTLWAAHLPVLQLVKPLAMAARSASSSCPAP